MGLQSLALRDIVELEPVLAGQQTLARGARGAEVRGLQRGLLDLGYGLLGGADGVFGKSTEAALRSFRELHGRVAAAVLDAATLALLDASLVRSEAVAGQALTNQRFVGVPALARLLAHKAPLPRKGEAVTRVQQALADLLFTLPRWGADGSIGDETREAVRQFQLWQRIRSGGELTPLTLMALDQLAPPPGQQVTRDPEYDRLIHDGLLTVTVAMGYDEDGNDLREFPELEQGLAAEGFTRTGSTAEDAVHTYTRALMIAGRGGSMRLRLISRRTASPEDRFADGLVQDSVTIYSGHARYGTGPDFDAIDSTAQNFVIGIGAPQHLTGELEPGYDPHMNQILAGVPNDLLSRRFDPQRYQVWAFLGCTTRQYLDELRELIDGKRTDNLDVIVSTRPIYWTDSAFYPLEIVRGLLRGRSINAIQAGLCAQAVATERGLGEVKAGAAFIGDGFGDNAPGWHI